MTACTEKEADEKWGPHARAPLYLGGGVLGTVNVAFAGNANEEKRITCIGSRCMQWRWLDMVVETRQPFGDNPRGYCGLAGRA